MDISVVIPTYNRADLLPLTLDTVLGQSRAPAEVIVVDDGSTDGTAAVVQKFADRVRYYCIENSGEFAARNFGVAHARYPWIAFCDSDDLWASDKLHWHAVLHRACPELAYSFSDFVIITDGTWGSQQKFDLAPAGYWEAGRTVVAEECWVIRDSLYERLIAYQPIFPSSVFIGRDFFESLGGWHTGFDRKRIVDFEFHLRCVVKPPIGAIHRPLVGIRKHAGNISGNLINMLLGEIDVLRYALLHHKPAERCRDTLLRSIARRQTNALDAAFLVGNYGLVRDLYRDMAPVARSQKAWTKYLIAGMPAPLRQPVARALTWLRQPAA
ncbi:MAG TPA: glycosyltransferase family A protein [Acetobacteraceae bacterium]|nr:glycosyltransferase family A protein [Acetobacteraceae bacterium]